MAQMTQLLKNKKEKFLHAFDVCNSLSDVWDYTGVRFEILERWINSDDKFLIELLAKIQQIQHFCETIKTVIKQ